MLESLNMHRIATNDHFTHALNDVVDRRIRLGDALNGPAPAHDAFIGNDSGQSLVRVIYK